MSYLTFNDQMLLEEVEYRGRMGFTLLQEYEYKKKRDTPEKDHHMLDELKELQLKTKIENEFKKLSDAATKLSALATSNEAPSVVEPLNRIRDIINDIDDPARLRMIIEGLLIHTKMLENGYKIERYKP